MGYGTRALDQLALFFERKLISLDKEQVDWDPPSDGQVKQPLLKKIEEIRPPELDYLGTSFGLTRNLFKFWHKGNYQPVYVRQTRN